MIGLDTNVLLRYILQDDPAQSALATELIESFKQSDPGFVSILSLTELYWVMDHTLKYLKREILEVLRLLLSTESLLFEEEGLVTKALMSYATGNADFDDCLIAGCSSASGCDFVFTFDKSAAKSGVMKLLI